jgi:hypothetical protein
MFTKKPDREFAKMAVGRVLRRQGGAFAKMAEIGLAKWQQGERAQKGQRGRSAKWQQGVCPALGAALPPHSRLRAVWRFQRLALAHTTTSHP